MSERTDRKKVAVMCSANDITDAYKAPALEFARLLVENNYDLIWGGSDTGLMKHMASEVQNKGGKIIGITMKALKHVARENADEMVVAENLGERKATILERADAIAVLVGGIGTFDEVTDMLEHKKHHRHEKLIVVLNTKDFYRGFETQLEKMQEEGFLTRPLDEMILFAQTPQEAIDVVNSVLKGK